MSFPEKTRLYRNANSQFFTHFDFVKGDIRYEVGFSYLEYRKKIHSTSKKIIYAMLAVLILVLVFFPLLFKTSLVNPLNKLLKGVRNVNDFFF